MPWLGSTIWDFPVDLASDELPAPSLKPDFQQDKDGVMWVEAYDGFKLHDITIGGAAEPLDMRRSVLEHSGEAIESPKAFQALPTNKGLIRVHLRSSAAKLSFPAPCPAGWCQPDPRPAEDQGQSLPPVPRQ